MFDKIGKKLLFFSNKDPIFIANVSTKLLPLLTLPGDWIYRSGEFAHSSISTNFHFIHISIVYNIQSGTVQFTIGRKQACYKKYVEGSYFGELEILYDTARKMNARSYRHCSLLVL
jgi:CRP-like cAMP-binding protein